MRSRLCWSTERPPARSANDRLTAEPVWVFGGVKPGKHTLSVEVVHNNHTPLNPPVKKTITFTMAKE